MAAIGDTTTTFVTLETTLGTIVVELYTRDAPKACENFVNLASCTAAGASYKDTLFHRVVAGALIQGGDTTGDGGASSFGYFFEDEISERLRFVGAGVVAMAAAMPNVNGSQFFITLAPLPQLEGRYTIFGRVASGMDAVWRIAGQRVAEGSKRPVTDIRIRACRVVHDAPRTVRPHWVRALCEEAGTSNNPAATGAASGKRLQPFHGSRVLAQLCNDED